MKPSTALVFLLLSAGAFAQTETTHCMTTTDSPMLGVSVRVLVACQASFPENTLWDLDRIDQVTPNLNGVAYRGHGGAGSVIYVVDSGVYANHDEFMTPAGSRVIAGIKVANPVENACPTADTVLAPCGGSPPDFYLNTEGTAAASAAAGKTVGVAPEASIVAVKIIDPFYFPTSRDLDVALDAIIQHAFDPTTPQFNTGIVILGVLIDKEEPPVTFAALTEKMRKMTTGVDREGNADPNGKRFFFTVAAGNNMFNILCTAGGPPKVFPATVGASIDGLVTVGGTSRDSDTVWSGSCGGAELYAPAEHLLVAMMTGQNHYSSDKNDSATSWSAAIVAGIAARMLEVNPNLTPAELEAQLALQSVPVGAGGAKMPLFLPPPPRARGVRH
jgi:subtilisin family serine protease